jgi:hypothetical protein
MEYLLLILLHVFFGIIWAGGGVIAGLFILPSVLEAGPAGGMVMAGVARRKLPLLFIIAASIVLLTGVRLYMMRFTTDWFVTKEGLALTLGALLAVGAFVMGVVVQKPTVERLGKLSAQIAASGAPPTAAQAADLQALRQKLRRIGALTGWHLLAAALLMAAHRLIAVL